MEWERGQDIPDPHSIGRGASRDPPAARDWTRRRGRSRRGTRWSERGGQVIPDPHRIGRVAPLDPPAARDWT
jgi:hypothetical protein